MSVLPNRREAQLISRTGEELHRWPWPIVGPNRRGTFPVDFVRHGEERLALLAFEYTGIHPLAKKLCAFAERDQWEIPAWCSDFETNQIPESTREGFSADDFIIAHFQLLDVFEEYDGLEIVAEFTHTQSWRAIRIYSLDGSLLYQVWHDGVCGSFFWMSGPKLLVVSGNNGECYWEDRGVSGIKINHPSVIFALRPRIGHISTKLLDVYGRGGNNNPEWYKFFGPPRYNDLIWDPQLGFPVGFSYDGTNHVVVGFAIDEISSGPNWIINSRGELASEETVTADDFHRRENAPDLSDLADIRELLPCPDTATEGDSTSYDPAPD